MREAGKSVVMWEVEGLAGEGMWDAEGIWGSGELRGHIQGRSTTEDIALGEYDGKKMGGKGEYALEEQVTYAER